jgi:hypothetical protein
LLYSPTTPIHRRILPPIEITSAKVTNSKGRKGEKQKTEMEKKKKED